MILSSELVELPNLGVMRDSTNFPQLRFLDIDIYKFRMLKYSLLYNPYIVSNKTYFLMNFNTTLVG